MFVPRLFVRRLLQAAAVAALLTGCGAGSESAGGPRTAELSWRPPETRAGGSPLGEIAGYRVHYGTAPGSYSREIVIDDPEATGYTVRDLEPGTYYFTVTAFDSEEYESAYSQEVYKTIR